MTTAGHGNQFVTLGGGFNTTGTGAWQQIITGLTPSSAYTLNFMMASETGDFGQSITVDFPTGSPTAPMTFSAAPSSANYWRNWESKSMTFVASSSSATLRFTSTTSKDVGLDNVRVVAAPVPEASMTVSFGLLLALGMGGLVVAGRRRKA